MWSLTYTRIRRFWTSRRISRVCAQCFHSLCETNAHQGVECGVFEVRGMNRNGQPPSCMEPYSTQDHEKATADPSSLRSVGMTVPRVGEYIGARGIFRADLSTPKAGKSAAFCAPDERPVGLRRIPPIRQKKGEWMGHGSIGGEPAPVHRWTYLARSKSSCSV